MWQPKRTRREERESKIKLGTRRVTESGRQVHITMQGFEPLHRGRSGVGRGEEREMNVALRLGPGHGLGRGEEREMNLALRVGSPTGTRSPFAACGGRATCGIGDAPPRRSVPKCPAGDPMCDRLKSQLYRCRSAYAFSAKTLVFQRRTASNSRSHGPPSHSYIVTAGA